MASLSEKQTIIEQFDDIDLLVAVRFTFLEMKTLKGQEKEIGVTEFKEYLEFISRLYPVAKKEASGSFKRLVACCFINITLSVTLIVYQSTTVTAAIGNFAISLLCIYLGFDFVKKTRIFKRILKNMYTKFLTQKITDEALKELLVQFKQHSKME